jgi:predicted phosphodiesterase
MRIAILTDIHSNYPALERALSIIEKTNIDRIFCLGDIIGYGPFPNECVDLVREHCNGVVVGNHDFGLIGKTPLSGFNKLGKKALQWTKKQISDQNLEFLNNLPLRIEENNITFVHSSPADPSEWTYITTINDVQDAFEAFSTQLCFFGHTHIPSIIGEDLSINQFRKDCRFLINTGSVGQPRDGDPRAAIGILDTNNWSYELMRFEYDVARTTEAIMKSGLPNMLAKRLINGI